MNKGLLIIGALSGFLAVGLGAFGGHGLKNIASSELVDIFNLAVQYQFYHTFALIAVAFAACKISSRLLNWAGYLFIAGIVLFSGSLYLYALTGVKWVGPITPLGGLCFMLGWLFFAFAALRSKTCSDKTVKNEI